MFDCAFYFPHFEDEGWGEENLCFCFVNFHSQGAKRVEKGGCDQLHISFIYTRHHQVVGVPENEHLADELGVFYAFYYMIKEEDEEQGRQSAPLLNTYYLFMAC